MRFTFLFSIISTSLIFTSCISTSNILHSYPKDSCKFSIADFNGNYSNKPDIENYTLWEYLYPGKYFKRDTTHVTPNSIINLNFDGKKTLIVTISDSNVISNKIELKVKLVDNYVSIKRKFVLIPIPFIFFHYYESKVVLSNEKAGFLNVKNSRNQFVWILLGGGQPSHHNTNFVKLEE